MIVARIFGGLGNQMFCYAAARRLALANNTDLVIDNISGFVNDHKYRRTYQLHNFNIPCRLATPSERLEPFPRVRRYIKKRFNSLREFEYRRYIRQEQTDFDARLLHAHPKGTVHIEGYWQSELYFKDFESVIRNDLQIATPVGEINHEVANQASTTQSVAVHVRFFDPPSGTQTNNAPVAYYSRAIEKIEEEVPDAHYFVFSDKPEAARASLPLSPDRVTVVSHNTGDDMAFADQWLMSQCKHFIISNSTFSWWAAWLGSEVDKIVIAPGFEKRDGEASWGFEGLLPPSWIKC